ncbi:MAG: hypothetical protein Fur0036_06290 [Fimbriimonadaceae bacterium]
MPCNEMGVPKPGSLSFCFHYTQYKGRNESESDGDRPRLYQHGWNHVSGWPIGKGCQDRTVP